MPIKSAKRPRGRPEHKPTPATRRTVSIAAGGGMRHEDIAIALGISRPTLDKWYQAELSEAASLRRMEVMQALYVAAKKGSSAAAKAYLAHDPQISAPPMPAGEAVAVKPDVKAPPLGKKDQAQADAQTAHVGTEWDSLLRTPAVTPIQ